MPTKPINIYPVFLRFQDRVKVLFWIEGADEQKDRYIKTPTGNVAAARTSTDMEELFKIRGKNIIHWNQYALINLDSFFRAIKNLKGNRSSTKATCSLIVNGWNFLEDMANTLALSKDAELFQSKVLSKMYDKLFAGMNLPATTPKNKIYSPLWTPDEIQALAHASKELWARINRTAPEITG